MYKNDLIIKHASDILSGSVNIIAGVRDICRLRLLSDDPDSELYMIFRSVDSETENFIIGPIRDGFSQSYLKKADKQMAAYISELKPHIFIACSELIRHLSKV